MNNRGVDDIGGNELVWHSVFDKIISIENLYGAWREFKRGKTSKKDVLCFEFNLEDNLFNLAEELKSSNYSVDKYGFFYVRDPKLRPIHKASVRDRVVFQAVFRVLYHIFDKQFIYDSYSCRFQKGTHAGVIQLRQFLNKVTNNYHVPVYILKCDVRKFFYSIDHDILKRLIQNRIKEVKLLHSSDVIIDSFSVTQGKGLPLGNVTSQLFANIYLNELDNFIKHELKCEFYLRYCDDFLIINKDRTVLSQLIPIIAGFLTDNLKLTLHPQKVEIRKLSQGIDFLGYVTLPHHVAFRTKTKKRMLRKILVSSESFERELITETEFNQLIQSYLGLLTHCNGLNLQIMIQCLAKNAGLPV